MWKKQKLLKEYTLIHIMKFIIVFPLLLLLTSCSQVSQVCFKEECIEVEIADSHEEQIKGLMFRNSLDQDRGMLFVYSDEDLRLFWMKNTSIPLDIIWINNQSQITTSHKANPCQEECEVYGGVGQYVLEVNQGTIERLGLEIGSEINIR